MTPRTLVTEFTINWTAIRAMSLFSSQDKCRYVLNGVLVERRRKHAVCVATNGAMLGAVVAPIQSPSYSGPVNVIIPLSLIQRLPVPKYDVTVVVETTQENLGNKTFVTVHSTENDLSVGSPAIDGNFLKWRQVLPNPSELQEDVRCSLNSEYLVAFQKAAKMLNHSYGRSITLRQKKHTDGYAHPYYVHTGIKEFTGVLMPTHTRCDLFNPMPEITDDND